MKKAMKVFALVLTLAIAVCIGAFAAGCNDEKEATEFSVTVLYPDGKAVDGTKDGNGDYVGNVVKVQFCDADNEENCYDIKNTTLGADGKFTIAISEIKKADVLKNVENFSVHILGLDGYTHDNVTLNSKNASITINLKAA